MSSVANIATHSVDLSRLTEGGFVLDAGCRDFNFSREMAALGCRVIALDPDPAVPPPPDFECNYMRLALGAMTGVDHLVLMENPEMRHLAAGAGHKQWGDVARVPVETASIGDLMQRLGVPRWDVVKLDIEGAEYEILRTWPGPIARQITVEFHDHLEPRPEALYDEIFGHLGRWYDVAVRGPQDTLFLLRPSAEPAWAAGGQP